MPQPQRYIIHRKLVLIQDILSKLKSPPSLQAQTNTFRTYPGSEFVVANTVAKRKKLEPNEIDFSQKFSQKVVSRSFSVFKSFINFYPLLIPFASSLDPDQARQNVGPDLDPNCLTPKIQHPNMDNNKV